MNNIINRSNRIKFKEDRRTLLREKKENEYQRCIHQYKTQQKIIEAQVTKVVLQHYAVAMPMYQKMTSHYIHDPQYAQKLDKIQESIDADNQSVQQDNKQLTKEETLKYIKQIEEVKIDSMNQLQKAVSSKKIQLQHMNSLMEVNKTRAFDNLYSETGVEEEDINKAFHMYKLSETAEFKAMMTSTMTSIIQTDNKGKS